LGYLPRVFRTPILIGLSLLIGIVLLTLPAKKAHATNPNVINFQGKVVNSNGTNVTDGTYSFSFVLFDDPTAGTESDGLHDKWHELSKSVTVTNGVFQTELGSATTLPDFSANSALYLGVKFNGDTSGSNGGYMTPRVHLDSVPYALNSDKLGGIASSGFVQLTPGSPQTGSISITGSLQSPTLVTAASTDLQLQPTTGIAKLNTSGQNNEIRIYNSAGTHYTAIKYGDISTDSGNITLNAAGGTVILGSNTTTVQKAASALSIDLATAATSTLTVTNSDGSNVANVDVEGSVTAGSNFSLSASGNTNAVITKRVVVSSAVGANDIVMIDEVNAGKFEQSDGTRPVAGVATSSQASPDVAQDIAISGTHLVNTDGNSTIALGDLVCASQDLSGAVIKCPPAFEAGQSVGYALSADPGGSASTIWLFIQLGVSGQSNVTLQNAYFGGRTINLSASGGIQIRQNTLGVSLFAVQDSAGTTNFLDVKNTGVTVSGQNSTATFSSELIASQDFSNGTYWTCSGWTTTSTTAQHNSGNTAACSTTSSNVSIQTGSTYLLSYKVNGTVAAGESVKPSLGGATLATINTMDSGYIQTEVFKATTTAALAFTPTSNYGGTITLVSLKKLDQIAQSVITINNTDGTTGLEIRSGGASTENVFIGVNSGAQNTTGVASTAVGTKALSKNTTGNYNHAFGDNALSSNTTGDNNNAFGYNALTSNTTGNNNSAFGHQALSGNSTGGYNTGIGTVSLENNTSGSHNTALGYSTLNSNSTGSGNTALGDSAMDINEIGANNVAIGGDVLDNNVNGNYNTGVGYQALGLNASGSFNSALGYAAGFQDPVTTNFRTLGNLQNATMVGYGAQAQASNVLILGSVGSTSTSLTPNIGIGTTAPSFLFSVSPNIYDTGTAYQDNGSAGVSGTTIHGIGTTWTSSMVGMEFIFATGQKETITVFTNATTLTGSVSQAVGLVGTAKNYRIHNPAFFVTNTGSTSIRTSTNSTAAFQVQNAAGTTLFGVDTANSQVLLGANTIKRAASGTTTVDLNDTGSTTLSIANSDGTGVASLSVEGDVAVGSGRVYKVGATSGSTISACSSNQYISSQAVTGGIVTGGSCTTSNLANTYNSAATTGNTIQLSTSGGAIKIQDATGPAVTGDLFDVQKNGGGVTYLGVSATGINIQSNFTGSAVNALSFDTSTATPHLKVFGSGGTNYANIYYDDSTTTAYFGASTGTAVLGTGTGATNISAGPGAAFTITGNASSTITNTAGDLTITDSAVGGTLALTAPSASGILSLQAAATINIGTTPFGNTTTTIQIGDTSGTSTQAIAIGNLNAGVNNVTLGSVSSGSTTTINSGTGGMNIGDNTVTKSINIGGVANSAADTVNIATNGSAADTVTIGSTNAASKTILQGGVNTTTSGTAGVIIGSATTDTNQTNLQLDSSSTFSETGSTCTTTINQGAMYYNTTSNAVRGCVNGAWEDVISSGSLGMQLFGVVPDTGTNPGDLASITGAQNGPCKVSVGANTTTVSWTSCVAFSGGRKVLVTAGTSATVNTIANNFQHLCLTGTNNQPALSTTGAENANLGTVSMPSANPNQAVNPILCLADIKFTGTNNTITQVYDLRTYTTSTKMPVTVNGTNSPVLGGIVIGVATKGQVTDTTTSPVTGVMGVIVATTGTTQTAQINAIIATNGPGAVKAVSGTNAVNNFVYTSATRMYATTSATTSALQYGTLGMARNVWAGATACSANADACQGSIVLNIAPR
jgi:hypothetical protein